MPKCYVGVDNKARTIKKMYIGVDGKARKIKKAWIGVDGKARLIFSGGIAQVELYTGTITSLASQMNYGIGVSFNNEALFSGGNTQRYGTITGYNTLINKYNSSLTRTTPASLSIGRSFLCAGSINGNALFMGGSSGSGTEGMNTIDIFNSSFSRTQGALSAKCYYCKATYNNGLIVAHNVTYQYDSAQYLKTVDKLDNSLTRTSLTSFSETPNNYSTNLPNAVSNGEYAYFVLPTGIEYYNKSFTKGVHSSVFVDSQERVSASVGNYAIFFSKKTVRVSGLDRTVYIAFAYDRSNTQTSISYPTTDNLTHRRFGSSDSYAIYGGSSYNAEIYDSSLVKTNLSAITGGMSYMMPAKAGRYMLFAGGHQNDTVGAYIIE